MLFILSLLARDTQRAERVSFKDCQVFPLAMAAKKKQKIPAKIAGINL
jgi:hypothetical protein